MKIGILTFHRPINYGALLQAYALSSHLSESFPNDEIEIIDYIAPKEKRKIFLNILRKIKYEGIFSGIKELKKIKIFHKSLSLLKLSKKYICSDKLDKLYDYINKSYDMLIIGSDAVFNWEQNGYPTAFIPQYIFNIPVFTYAASVHGLKYLEQPQERINACGKAFDNMQFVSVRDKCTENFVRHCTSSADIAHCCDPTFLIDFEKLYTNNHRSIKEIFNAYSTSIEKKYIVLMLQNDEISKEVYNRYSGDYTIVSLFGNNKYSDVFMFDLNPVEWCLVLKHAALVFTNYFHGTLLTLQQGNAAMVVDVSRFNEPYEGKLFDLMCTRLGLADMYIKVEDLDCSEACENFFKCAQKYLSGEYKESINKAVNNEKQSYSVFEDTIHSIIKEV